MDLLRLFLLFFPALQQGLPCLLIRVQLVDFLPDPACIFRLSLKCLVADGLDLDAELILILPAFEEVEIVFEFLPSLGFKL